MKRHMRLVWALLVVTLIFGTMYVLVLQQNRLSANANPDMIANEAVMQLETAEDVQNVNMGRVDVLKSYTPFLNIYDKNGYIVTGSGYVAGKVGELPAGALNHATPESPHAVTWAPTEGTKVAVVIYATDKYYVLGGQSLAPTEKRADTLRKWFALGYSLTLVTLVVGYGFYSGILSFAKVKLPKKKNPKTEKPEKTAIPVTDQAVELAEVNTEVSSEANSEAVASAATGTNVESYSDGSENLAIPEDVFDDQEQKVA